MQKANEEVRQNLIKSTKIAAQASLLTVSYSIGYGCGSATRQFKKLVDSNPGLSFVKEITSEMKNGYDKAVSKIEEEVESLEAKTA